MPGPRRSEDEPVLSGESATSRSDDRRVEAGRIIVTPMPRAMTSDPIPGLPSRTMPTAPEPRTGAWVVVIVYLISAAALGYAIWERFLR